MLYVHLKPGTKDFNAYFCFKMINLSSYILNLKIQYCFIVNYTKQMRYTNLYLILHQTTKINCLSIYLWVFYWKWKIICCYFRAKLQNAERKKKWKEKNVINFHFDFLSWSVHWFFFNNTHLSFSPLVWYIIKH